MPQEPRSCISYPQPPIAAKRPNTSLDFTKTPPELPQSNKNTESLESILKGKVIKEFVPQAQKRAKGF
jgi:U3 small nucleolar ribonucleoprotein component